MKVSARHIFARKVRTVKAGSIDAEVVLTLAGGGVPA